MERRRLWWPVAGGSRTVIWERVALLAIPSTRENCRSILVVNSVTRGEDAQVIGVIASPPSSDSDSAKWGVTLKAMAQGSQLMVSKPVGVRIAWCVGVGFQDGFRLRNLAGLQPSRPHCRMPWSNDRSHRKLQRYTKQRKGG